MYIYYCDKCGFELELTYVKLKNCPQCKNSLTMEEAEYPDEAPTVEAMRTELERSGNKVVWDFIEQIEIPKARLEYREVFFKAGGQSV